MKVSRKAINKRQKRRGATVVETAIVMLPLLMFILGIFEYGRIMMIRNVAENACREGARFAVVHTYDKTTTDIQNTTLNMLGGQNNCFLDSAGGAFTASDVLVFNSNPTTGANLGAWTNAQFGQAITVQISGQINLAATRLIGISTLSFTVQSTMLSEAN